METKQGIKCCLHLKCFVVPAQEEWNTVYWRRQNGITCCLFLKCYVIPAQEELMSNLHHCYLQFNHLLWSVIYWLCCTLKCVAKHTTQGTWQPFHQYGDRAFLPVINLPLIVHWLSKSTCRFLAVYKPGYICMSTTFTCERVNLMNV